MPTRRTWPPRAPGGRSFSGGSDLRLSREELLATAGITDEQLAQLEDYGLVSRRPGTGHYDTDALIIATAAARAGRYGLEPRHLRAFKTAADREGGLIEQVVAPVQARPRRRRPARADGRP